MAQATDCADWLPNDLLTKLDRCLMAHGVEGRVPFLDSGVAAFAFRLPDELKVKRGLGKYLLRRWLAGQSKAARADGEEARLHRAGRRMDRAARRTIRSAGGVRNQVCVRSAFAGSVEKLFTAAAEKRAGFAAWTLLFYALWHRHHIQRLPPAPDVFAALAGFIRSWSRAVAFI